MCFGYFFNFQRSWYLSKKVLLSSTLTMFKGCLSSEEKAFCTCTEALKFCHRRKYHAECPSERTQSAFMLRQTLSMMGFDNPGLNCIHTIMPARTNSLLVLSAQFYMHEVWLLLPGCHCRCFLPPPKEFRHTPEFSQTGGGHLLEPARAVMIQEGQLCFVQLCVAENTPVTLLPLKQIRHV